MRKVVVNGDYRGCAYYDDIAKGKLVEIVGYYKNYTDKYELSDKHPNSWIMKKHCSEPKNVIGGELL